MHVKRSGNGIACAAVSWAEVPCRSHKPSRHWPFRRTPAIRNWPHAPPAVMSSPLKPSCGQPPLLFRTARSVPQDRRLSRSHRCAARRRSASLARIRHLSRRRQALHLACPSVRRLASHPARHQASRFTPDACPAMPWPMTAAGRATAAGSGAGRAQGGQWADSGADSGAGSGRALRTRRP